VKKLEKLIKITLLSAFCIVNAIDMIQTFAFLRMGIESNSFAVNYPSLWFPLKIALTFGLPLGLYRLDVYLKSRKSEGFLWYLKWFVILTYASILLADILYARLILRNMSILGRL